MGNYIFVKFEFFFSFGGRKHPPLNRSRWNLPNLTLIGATCRPCQAKNPKIGPWVNKIPAELPFGQILPVTMATPTSVTATPPAECHSVSLRLRWVYDSLDHTTREDNVTPSQKTSSNTWTNIHHQVLWSRACCKMTNFVQVLCIRDESW